MFAAIKARLAAVRAYFAKFYTAAKSKATTYIAMGTAGITELTTRWDSFAALIPTWVVSHKAEIFATAALLPIWSRIRREISGK